MTVLNRPKIWLHRLLSPIISRIAPVKWKEWNEMYYWKKRKGDEGTLRNTHYKRYYTEFFKIEDEFYKNKSILDIGCGPRGSLEWATRWVHMNTRWSMSQRIQRLCLLATITSM